MPRYCQLPASLDNDTYDGIMEKNMETTIVYWDYNGIMEKNMETTIVYWGYNGIMENEMETPKTPTSALLSAACKLDYVRVFMLLEPNKSFRLDTVTPSRIGKVKQSERTIWTR